LLDSYVAAAGWSSQVARRAHNPKVAGSNPAPAMNESPTLSVALGVFRLRRRAAGRAAARWSWCAALSEMAITSKARVLEGVLGRGLAAGQLLDPLLGCRDDGMVGVVVLLQTKRLPVERSPDVLLLASPLNLGVMLAPGVPDGPGEVEPQQSQPVGSQDAPAHELDDLTEDRLLLDLKRTRMPCRVGGELAPFQTNWQRNQFDWRWWVPSIRRSHSPQGTRPRRGRSGRYCARRRSGSLGRAAPEPGRRRRGNAAFSAGPGSACG
jgi:hypothetical protein